MIPAFFCRDVHFVIATVDTPAEEEGGEERGGREGRGRRGKKVRRGGEESSVVLVSPSKIWLVTI